MPASRVGWRTAVVLFHTLLLCGLVYRLRLAFAVGQTVAAPAPRALWALVRAGAADAAFALLVSALLLLTVQLLHAVRRRGSGGVLDSRPWLRWLARGLLGVFLLGVGMMSQAQLSVLVATGSGLTAQLIEESLALAAVKELPRLLTRGQLGACFLPLVLFIALFHLPRGLRRPVDYGLGVITIVLVVMACVLPAAPLPAALRHHPVGFVALELVHSPGLLRRVMPGSWTRNKPPAAPSLNLDTPPAEADRDVPAETVGPGGQRAPAMALLAPEFVLPADPQGPQHTTPGAPADPPYNLLIILMESTGFDYAMSPTADGRFAMPFLRALAAKGYSLEQHFSSGNSSPRGIFSLFSGLYVLPEVTPYDIRPDIHLPSLATYLGPRYRSFLVTPSSLDYYFPQGFFVHGGLAELWDYRSLPMLREAPGGISHARDEAGAVDFFLQRLDEQRGAPFLAVYYSFLGHWPYPDYGPATHFVAPTTPLHAYYNNLRYLDTQIARIFAHLQERQLLDRTIVVLIGDHGEAFGQHAQNFTHARMSYNENLRTPAIIYQPTLFPPRRLTVPTSHVDILPTLLDALHVPYDPTLLQGESLLARALRRRYLFIYGNEDTLTSVGVDGIKLQIALPSGDCWVFDLRRDPSEQQRLGCTAHNAQKHALLLYLRHQPAALRRYNKIAYDRSMERLRSAPAVRQNP